MDIGKLNLNHNSAVIENHVYIKTIVAIENKPEFLHLKRGRVSKVLPLVYGSDELLKELELYVFSTIFIKPKYIGRVEIRPNKNKGLEFIIDRTEIPSVICRYDLKMCLGMGEEALQVPRKILEDNNFPDRVETEVWRMFI